MSIRIMCLYLCVVASGSALGLEAPGNRSLVTDDPMSAESFMRNPQFTVMVVRILETDVVEGSYRTPPSGSFRVVEILRGESVKPGDYRYEILSPRSQADGPNREETVLRGPRAGSDLIVFAYLPEKPVSEGETIILQGPLIEAGQNQRSAVAEALVHDSPLLLPLFLIVLISPALGLLPRHGWLAPAVAFIAYAAYETLVNPAYNIRVDVLLLWPALGLSIVVPVVAHAWRKNQKSGMANL